MKEKIMVQIIVINGMPGCGKTTFEEYCLKKLAPYADMLSTVTFVKEIAEKCGWNGTEWFACYGLVVGRGIPRYC